MPNADDLERERLAAEAFEHIQVGNHWDDWVVIAAGFDVGRRKAMRSAGSNRPRGGQYSKAFSKWLHHPCRSEIKEWRETLPTQERIKWNHPSVVKLRFERHQRKLDAKPRPRGKGGKPTKREFEPPHPVHMLHHVAQRWGAREIEDLKLDDDEVKYLAQDAPWVLPALNAVCETHDIETGLRSLASSEVIDLQPTIPPRRPGRA